MITKGSAKAEILASIRENLATSVPFDILRGEHETHSRSDAVVSERAEPYDMSQSAVTARFRENLEAVGGKCSIANSDQAAFAILQAIVDDLKPDRVAISDSRIVRAAIKAVKTDAAILENATASELFDCDLGFTGAQWAIAETGTLVLESEKEFTRLTSLVPGVHVCILDAANIRQTMGEMLEILEQELNPAITFITGPSRTSDIELTLAIGVHGPRELYVIVVDADRWAQPSDPDIEKARQ